MLLPAPGPLDRLRQNAPALLLGVALLAAAAVLLSFAAELTWFQDSWEYLMNRRGISVDALMQPHNEHIVVIPVAIAQLGLRVFGMESPLPEQVVLTALLLGTATAVFAYVRRCIGPWPALMAALLLLFLGPAWQDLLWVFQISLVGSVLFGVMMLLALDRAGRRRDVAACALLAVSVCFSSLGLAFALGAAVDVLQRRRSRGLRRAYVFLVPLAIYGLWYLGWGHAAASNLSLHNVLVSPRYLGEGFAASLDSLLALGTIFDEAVGRSQWGVPLLIALVLLVVYAQVRRPGVSPRLWPVLAAAAGFWLPAAFNFVPGREAYSSRYLFVGAVFVLLLAAELLRGVRIGRWGLLAAGAVTLVAVGFNLTPLREGRDFLEGQTVLARADLTAIEISQRSVDPAFTLPPEIAGTPFLNEIEAGEYLRAVEEYGSPAYAESELEAAPEAGRKQADIVLANALPLSIEIAEGEAPAGPRLNCIAIGPRAAAGHLPLPLRPGLTTVELAPGGVATVRLRRFATAEYPLSKEAIPGGSTVSLRIPADEARRPWRLSVEAKQAARVCR